VLGLERSRSRGETVAAHDLHHLCSEILDLTEEFEGQGLQFIGVEMPPKPPKSR